MNKTEAYDIIRKEAYNYGFKSGFYETGGHLWIEPMTGEKYINFCILETLDADRCDFKNGKYAGHLEVQSSICRMGGNTSPEELLKAAAQIKAGAQLTQLLQKTDLAYEEMITEG